MTASRVLDTWVRPTRGALDNARSALVSLAGVVADRVALTTEPVDELPGALHSVTADECYRLLATRAVGRMAYVARAGVPDIAPVNFVLDGKDLLFRSGPGPKLQAAERREIVAFEVDEIDEKSHVGWSVVVIGRAARVRDTPAAEPAPWADGPRNQLVRIRPTRVTGRRLS